MNFKFLWYSPIRPIILFFKRTYSSLNKDSPQLSNIPPVKGKVNGEWITGFCDRSAYFGLSVVLRKVTGRWEIRPELRILVDARFINVLEVIKNYFGVGRIFTSGKNAVFIVSSVKDLINIIIPHFNKFPLLTCKQVTFILWVKAINMIYSNLHKTPQGFMEILSLYAAMNRGISSTVKTHFPELKPAELPHYFLNISPFDLSEWWISGYFTIYCNFKVDTDPHGLKNSYYDRVIPSFNFSRNIKELPILSLIASYFSVKANTRSDGTRVDVNVYGIDNCMFIVDLFKSFPLLSCKQDEFNLWAKIIRDKERLDSSSLKSSLSRYMSHFTKLVSELDSLKK